jgi:hypothetical protein
MTGSAPSNSQAVDFEKQQAAEADAKEAARQQRLQQGQTLIDQIFNGAPVMKSTSTPFDWSSFSPLKKGSAPAGYTAVQIPGGTSASGAADAIRSSSPSGFITQDAQGNYTRGGSNVASPAWGLRDASGKIYKQGDPLSITTQTPTGQTTGGFDDAFFDAYKQKVLDYYQPDEQRQYDEAQRDLKYSLARAGTLESSTAGDKQGELAYNDALQKANIVANANAQEGTLKSQIQANKQSLINQLYSTEDPTLTANLAESSAAASRLQNPTLTPAASLFAPALSAAGAVGNYLTSPYGLYGSGGSSGAGGTPSVRPANESSGKLSSGGWG